MSNDKWSPDKKYPLSNSQVPAKNQRHRMITTKIVPLLFRNGIWNLFKKSGPQLNWSLYIEEALKWPRGICFSRDFPVFHTLVSATKLKVIFWRDNISLTSAEKLPIMSFIVFIWLAFVKWIFWDIVISSFAQQLRPLLDRNCCDMDQSDTIGKIELFPSIVLSSDNTDCKNDIQLFHQLFDELSVHTDYH